MSANQGSDMSNPLMDTDSTAASKHEGHRNIRYAAAVLSGATAVIYFLIGLRVLIVLDANADQTWALFAAAAYALGAVLLLAVDRRSIWILGAILQIFVITTYFNLASQRLPAFEVWGILLRVVQLIILITLAYLAIRSPMQSQPGTAHE